MNSAVPFTDPDAEYFWKGVANNELLLRRCLTCKVAQHPAQTTAVCGSCHGFDFEQFPASGFGTVYTWIVSTHPTKPDDSPRVVALIELAEGVRLVSNVIDVDIAAIRNEMPVVVCFTEYNGLKLPQFRPA